MGIDFSTMRKALDKEFKASFNNLMDTMKEGVRKEVVPQLKKEGKALGSELKKEFKKEVTGVVEKGITHVRSKEFRESVGENMERISKMFAKIKR